MKNLVRFLPVFLLLWSCAPQSSPISRVAPAREYASAVRAQMGIPVHDEDIIGEQGYTREYSFRDEQAGRAKLNFVKDLPPEQRRKSNIVTNMESEAALGAEPIFMEEHNTMPDHRPYTGPLSLGDPGVGASLFKEARADNDLFRDHRAFRPMDLITIMISETVDAEATADTEVSSDSSILSGITNLFNFEADIVASNPSIDPASLINTTSSNSYSGEGDTTRESSFEASMSAMVVEVLPSGVMRIEGKRIVTINSEEQTMVITGLVRPRDVSPMNEVMSSKIANLRVDFFGNGTIADVQEGGAIGNFVRRWWPF